MTFLISGGVALAVWLLVSGSAPRRALVVAEPPLLRPVWNPVAPAAQWLRRRQEARRRSEATADVIELMTVVLGSGGTVLQALRVVTSHGPDSTHEPLRQLHEQLRVGTPLSLALVVCADRLGPSYRATVSALLASERDGAPLSVLLVRLSEEARAARRRKAESQARRLPVQLLFPLVFCSLPAVLVGAVVPLVALSLGRL